MDKEKTQEKKSFKRITPKQAKLMEEITKNPELSSRQLVINAGYSPKTASNPNQILKSIPFQEIFNNKISNNMVIAAHKKLLKAKQRVRIYKKGELMTEIVQEDTLGISKGVELAYKVKGAFAPVETKHTITGLENKSDEELDELMKEEDQAFNRAENFKKKAIDIPSAKVSKAE